MSDKRFTLNLMKKPSEIEMDGKMISKYDVVRLLNEQQSTINKLKSDIEETEISIKLFEDDIATKDKKIEEQQATIRKLQDLCGESDSENAKLRIENEQLKNKLNKTL